MLTEDNIIKISFFLQIWLISGQNWWAVARILLNHAVPPSTNTAGKLELMELENIVANTVYLKAREGGPEGSKGRR